MVNRVTRIALDVDGTLAGYGGIIDKWTIDEFLKTAHAGIVSTRADCHRVASEFGLGYACCAGVDKPSKADCLRDYAQKFPVDGGSLYIADMPYDFQQAMEAGWNFADANHLRLNLGAGGDIHRGFINIDARLLHGIDIVRDLEKDAIPLQFSSEILIKLNVNPLSAPDYIKEYRKIQSKIDVLIKNISEIQGELTKLIETLGTLPRGQQVININGETINIGTLADKIENITNMIKQLNETLTVKQNVTVMLYDHERNELKSTINALASMIGYMLSEIIFDVKRGRWDMFNDALVRRRDALMRNQKALQKIISRLEKQHKASMDMIITRAPQSIQQWLQMLDDASDLLNMMLEIANSPPQLRDPEFSKATYNKMIEFYNKYKSMIG